MELGDLRALLSIVQHGSFLAASHALGVPRTTLRRQLERLEATIGVPLLLREGRGVRLTLAGERVVKRSGPLLSQAAQMVSEAQGEDNLGVLKMIVPVGVPNAVRVRALTSLQAMGTGLSINVIEADNPLDHLREPFDVMIHIGDSPPLSGWFSRVLQPIGFRLMASPAYLERAGMPEDVAALSEHALLTWRALPWLESAWPLLSGESFPIKPSVISANVSLLNEFAVSGGGIAMLSDMLGFYGASLVPVLDGVVGGQSSIRILMRQPSRSDPRLHVLAQNLDRLLAMLPGAG